MGTKIPDRMADAMENGCNRLQADDNAAMRADPATRVRRAIEFMFARSWEGPQTASFSYLDGADVRTAVYRAFSIDITGIDAESAALGAVQQELYSERRMPGEASRGEALVWRSKPTVEEGRLYFRFAVIPAHVVQILLREAD